MPTINIEADISVETLVKATEQLSPLDLQRFRSQVLAISAKRAAPSVSESEAQCLLRINQRLPIERQQRYDRLIAQREFNLGGNSPTSPDAIQFVLNNGQTIFSAFCETLSTIGLKTISETVNWTEILPSHFTTDLSFEVLNLVVAQMESSGIIEDCTVFNNQ